MASRLPLLVRCCGGSRRLTSRSPLCLHSRISSLLFAHLHLMLRLSLSCLIAASAAAATAATRQAAPTRVSRRDSSVSPLISQTTQEGKKEEGKREKESNFSLNNSVKGIKERAKGRASLPLSLSSLHPTLVSRIQLRYSLWCACADTCWCLRRHCHCRSLLSPFACIQTHTQAAFASLPCKMTCRVTHAITLSLSLPRGSLLIIQVYSLRIMCAPLPLACCCSSFFAAVFVPTTGTSRPQ